MVVLKWVGAVFVGFDGGAAFFIEDGEPEIEAPKQFDEPLVNKRFGNENEGTLDPASEEKTMQDEAAFDGFAEADFIGEKDARVETAGDFGGDI